jgi:DNA-binding ferritin-like protein (Dps family)
MPNWIAQKKRWRQYRARVQQLPENYRAAIEAVQRYSFYFGGGTAEGSLAMFDDLADLFEEAAANETPVREIFGADPVEFAQEFLANYPEGAWIHRERERLRAAVNQAAGENTGADGISR